MREPELPLQAPPHSLEAEAAILGGIIIGTPDIEHVFDLLDAEDFFNHSNRTIFQCLLKLHRAGQPTNDLNVLVDALRESWKLDDAGGVDYVAKVGDGIPRIQPNLPLYISTLSKTKLLRRLMRLGERAGKPNAGNVFAEVIQLAEMISAPQAAEVPRIFAWENLQTESQLKVGGGADLSFIVEGLIPADDMTMLAGREGSLKTLLALYFGKCVANGEPVFGRLKTIKKPVLYLDAENHSGTHGVYLRFFEGIGPEEIRFFTLSSGVPALNDPALLKLVQEKRPLLIVDSLIRFCGTRDRDNTEMTLVMEQLARLVTAGATILLIHHARRSDEEEYANSFAIGATVAFWYAVTAETSLEITRCKLICKKARGASPINRSLIAFPAILDQGAFALDGDVPKTDKELVFEFVRARDRCNFSEIRDQLRGIGIKRKKAALDEAINAGELVKTEAGREVFFTVRKIGSGAGTPGFDFRTVPESEPMQSRSDPNDEE
jgi:hypothetical protein